MGPGRLAEGVGVHHGEGSHVDDTPYGRRGSENVHRARRAEQDRPDGDAVARGGLQQIESDIGGVESRHDQKIRLLLQARAREICKPQLGVEGRIAVHIFCAEGASLVPKLECDSRAALGTTPKRRITSAASAVISASCSAVGSRLTYVSQMKTVRLGSMSAFIA